MLVLTEIPQHIFRVPCYPHFRFHFCENPSGGQKVEFSASQVALPSTGVPATLLSLLATHLCQGWRGRLGLRDGLSPDGRDAVLELHTASRGPTERPVGRGVHSPDQCVYCGLSRRPCHQRWAVPGATCLPSWVSAPVLDSAGCPSRPTEQAPPPGTGAGLPSCVCVLSCPLYLHRKAALHLGRCF